MARLHLHSFGDDLANVLLLHGLASAGPVWWRVAEALADAGHSSLAPDLRGHGESSHTDDYTLEGYARDVIESCRGPWDLVIGHSLGGAVAVRTGTIDPGFARGFLLVDPAIDIDADAARQLRADLVEQVARPPSVDQLVADFPKWHRGDCERKRAALLATSPDVMKASLDDNPDWHLGHELAALRAPTHLLGADTDPLYSADEFDRHRDQNGRLSFEVVPDTGHSIYRDDAGAVIAAALTLLAG
ncbi:MAG: alpha/beta hydrolase [Actinomycetota bacterium]